MSTKSVMEAKLYMKTLQMMNLSGNVGLSLKLLLDEFISLIDFEKINKNVLSFSFYEAQGVSLPL